MLAIVTTDWNLLETQLSAASADLTAVCETIASIMGVGNEEVGLLRVCGLSLEFVYPVALRSTGRILLSSSAVAARTVTSKKAELFNTFATINHNNVFELVPLGGISGAAPLHVQKLMSVPVQDVTNHVVGVLQISRKAKTRDEAGPDFTEDDLRKLTEIAQKLSTVFQTKDPR